MKARAGQAPWTDAGHPALLTMARGRRCRNRPDFRSTFLRPPAKEVDLTPLCHSGGCMAFGFRRPWLRRATCHNTNLSGAVSSRAQAKVHAVQVEISESTATIAAILLCPFHIRTRAGMLKARKGTLSSSATARAILQGSPDTAKAAKTAIIAACAATMTITTTRIELTPPT